MIPLFEFFAAGSIAVAIHKATAKSIDFALGRSSLVFYKKRTPRSGNFPLSGPILTSGTIFPVCTVLIWHLLSFTILPNFIGFNI